MQRSLYSALLLLVGGWAGWTNLLCPSSARADFYTHPWEDFHDSGVNPDSGVQLSYFNTSSNYETGGGTGAPAGLQNFSRFFMDVDLEFPFTPAFTVYGRLDWMTERLNSVSTTGSGTSTGGTGYGLGDQTVGANYRVLDTKGDTPGRAARTTIDLQAQSTSPAIATRTPLRTAPPRWAMARSTRQAACSRRCR